ncbi:MAG TPA: bacterioferritin [Rhizomicrobium sp.]|nr:bacterioferritin [Rhizomicrobium sp.]
MPGNDRRNAGSGQGGGPAGSGGIGPSPIASLPGDPKVLRFLNLVLKNELTAINQYFLHSRMLADWGLSELAKHEYDESVDEMRHADRLIKRVLVLGGLPNLQDLGKLLVGEDVEDVIGCDLKLELASRPELQAAIAHCEKVSDYVSRELFVHILENEEEHIDWLQTQLRMIHQMGLQNYVQLQSEPKGASSS